MVNHKRCWLHVLIAVAASWLEMDPALASGDDPATADATRARLTRMSGRVSLAFEENRGQTNPQVKFLSRGSGYTLFLTSTEAVLSLHRPTASAEKTNIVRMKILGADEHAHVVGVTELPGTSNYFIGKDRARWQPGVPSYAGVRYQGIYRGVDLVFHGSSQR